MSSIHEKVESQFAPTAASYATSSVHADAANLHSLVELVKPNPTDEVLDVATGAGHTALSFAPHVHRVVALDLTASMLDQTLRTAQERHLNNVDICRAHAENVPLPDESFDIYTVRLAPHHFADIRATIREAFRLLKPDGKYLVVDSSAPEDDDLDQQIHEIEVLRDHSHVRNYRISEWKVMLREAGFEIKEADYGYMKELDLDDWMTRMNTPEVNQIELRRRFREASPALQEALKIRIDGDKVEFKLPRVTILAHKPGLR